MMGFLRRLFGRFVLQPPAPSEVASATEPVASAVRPVQGVACVSTLINATHGLVTPAEDGLSNAYRSANLNDGANQPRLFDPALKHFSRAFRAGDPLFADVAEGERWLQARRQATDHVLRRIAESPRGDRLVLRGSRLLRAWFGEAAREPGDLDWVFDPPTASLSDSQVDILLGEITAAVLRPPAPDGFEFGGEGVASDRIWMYERNPGRRLVFPWRVPGLPGGVVQVDIVFGEALAEPARRMSIPVADEGCASVRGAGPAQSLAWKLIWLGTDMYPQGKDLYDAVLLAERFPLPAFVLERACWRAGPDVPPASTIMARVGELEVDWENFRAEYPWIDGDGSEWLDRLERVLRPASAGFSGRAFGAEPAQAEGQGDGRPIEEAVIDPSWRTPEVVGLAEAIAADRDWVRLPELVRALQDARCDDPEILAHCQIAGPHSAGCWVVDLILEGR